MALRERQRREQQDHSVVLADDLLWGAKEIADYIGRPIRQVYYLIAQGVIPIHRAGARTLIARKSEITARLTSARNDA